MKKNSQVNELRQYLNKQCFCKRLAYLVRKLEKKRIVIYGAGWLFEEINKNYNLKDLNIIALADRNFINNDISEYLGYPTCKPSEIVNLKPDVVLISTLKFFDVLATLDKEAYDQNNIKILPLLKMNFFDKIKRISEIKSNIRPAMPNTNVNGLYLKNSEMTISESLFLKDLIIKKQPQKILELGVAAGASSTLVLDTIKDMQGTHLYSIDFSTEYYRDTKKMTGFVVPDELRDKWTLFTGGLAYRFIEKIGQDIDFCILDTVHSNPGELLDFLMIYPFLSNNCTVVIHDITRHTQAVGNPETCSILFNSINGKKLIPKTTEYKYLPNIGAVEFEKNSYDSIFSQFMLLGLNWHYLVSRVDLENLKAFFAKYYNNELVKIYEKAVEYNIDLFQEKTTSNTSKSFKCNIDKLNTVGRNLIRYLNY